MLQLTCTSLPINMAWTNKFPFSNKESNVATAKKKTLTVYIFTYSKNHKFEFFSLCNSGAFSAIMTAYNESTDAAKKVKASGNSVNTSAHARKVTSDLHNRVQPANTRTLDKLNQSMASWPDLTPVAKQVIHGLNHCEACYLQKVCHGPCQFLY